MFSRLPAFVQFVCHKLVERGHEAVVVGGCARDILLGREPHDWDVATSAHPQDVLELFCGMTTNHDLYGISGVVHTVPTGLKHGTVTVVLSGEQVEVTSFRTDGEYSDGRRPDGVRFGVTLKEDLARRDFTMNAIAYDPSGGVIVDPFDGRLDIERKLIRAVGDPRERFTEDALRIMRAFRFSAVLGFPVEPKTEEAAMALAPTLSKVSAERVRDELLKLLVGRNAATVLECMTPVLDVVLPELSALRGVAQNSYHQFDVWGHTLAVVGAIRRDPMLRLAALLHDVGKPTVVAPHPSRPGENQFIDHEKVGADMTDSICERLKLSNEDRKFVVTLVRNHIGPLHLAHAKMPAIRRFLRQLGVEYLEPLMKLCAADVAGKGNIERDDSLGVIHERFTRAMEEKPVVSTRQLAISGKDVMETCGIPSGPEVGKVLAELLERVTDDPSLNERDKLLALLPLACNNPVTHS